MYAAAYQILKEEYLDQAIRRERGDQDSEIGENRVMLCLKVGGMKNTFVFDPAYPVTIGRSTQENKLCLKDPAISARHCQLQLLQGKLWVKDEGSSNGTGVRQEKSWYWVGSGQSVPLQSGDILCLGSVLIKVILFYYDTMLL